MPARIYLSNPAWRSVHLYVAPRTALEKFFWAEVTTSTTFSGKLIQGASKPKASPQLFIYLLVVVKVSRV
jgi:hypothetical protein